MRSVQTKLDPQTGGTMKKTLSTIILIWIIIGLFSQDKKVISIPYQSLDQLQNYVESGYDIAQVFTETKEIHIVVDDTQLSYFQSKYSNVKIEFTEAELRENLASTYRNIPGYMTYAQMVTRLHELVDLYPDYCKLIELGPSQGKLYTQAGHLNYLPYDNTIYALKVSNNVSVYQDKPNYYFKGAIHAREPLSAEIVMAIIEDFLDTYSESNADHPINTSQIWFVPVINPDGHNVVLSGLSTMHRKTIRDNNNNNVFDSSDGIDANRNFNYYFGTTGVSSSISNDTYPGPYANSAVEVSYLADLIHQIPFIAGFVYHTYGHLVLWPYGYAYGANSSNPSVASTLAIELANRMPRYNNPDSKYTPQASWELYPASGTSDDYYHYYNILAYTVELAGTFIPSAAEVNFHKINQLPAAYHLVSRHKNSFLTGLVTDASTGEPVKAEIKVFPLDNHFPEKETVYSDLNYGRYNYALMPGNYTLSVRAANYHHFVTDFEITATGQTVIDVNLEPAASFSVLFYFLHDSIENNFSEVSVHFSHSRIENLTTDSNGFLLLNDVNPGDILISARGVDSKRYITTITIPDVENNTEPKDSVHYEILVVFDDLDFADDFDTLYGNWTGSGWALSTSAPYSGTTSMMLSTFTNNNALTLTNPIPIPAGEKTYVSFMTRYAATMQSAIYMEFDVSEDGVNWETIQQIRHANRWLYYYYVFPEDSYQQMYFRFRVRRHASATSSPFLIDMFTVNSGEAYTQFIKTSPPLPVTLLTPQYNEIVPQIAFFSWVLNVPAIYIDGLRLYITEDEDVWDEYFDLPGDTTETDTTTLAYGLEFKKTYYWKVVAYNNAGDSVDNQVFKFINQDGTDTQDPIPDIYVNELIGNYPNPFNPETTIHFSITQEGNVTIDLFNIRGQKIRTLVNEIFGGGTHRAVWDGLDDNGQAMGSGVYFFRMQTDDYVDVKRMVLMK